MKALLGFEISDERLFWVRNFLVDFFWVERLWQYFFSLIKNVPASRFSTFLSKNCISFIHKLRRMFFFMRIKKAFLGHIKF